MIDLVGWLFRVGDFTPHGMCLAWEPGLMTWTMLGDALTALAYLWIPIQLALAARGVGRGGRLVLSDQRWVLGLFGSFILLCGGTHVLHVETLFVPIYRAQAALTMATALVSIATAALLQWVFRVEPPSVPLRVARDRRHDHVDDVHRYNLLVERLKAAAGADPAERLARMTRLVDLIEPLPVPPRYADPDG